MSELIRFRLYISDPQASLFEELLGDLLLSSWWSDSGEVEGILAASDEQEWRERIQNLFGEVSMKLAPLEERDWLQEDQDKLCSIEIGKFVIHYEERKIPSSDEKIHFILDSAHAFGSGHHETTKGCILALQELCKNFQPQKCLDIGTGSGILSMAMAVLWKTSVFASDLDAESVRIASENLARNSTSGVWVVQCAGIDHPELKQAAPFDLIVANIHSDPLCELAESISRVMTEGGLLVLSGIMLEQHTKVLETYRNFRFVLVNRFQENQWLTLVLQY